MSVLRFIGNLILALALIALSVAVMFSAYAAVGIHTRETRGLDYAAQDGHWAWLDQGPLYYRTWGDPGGKLAVLVHGRQVEGSETWRELADGLARSGMYVVAFDLPGYGHSRRDLAETHTVRSQAQALGQALNQMGLWGGTIITFDAGAAVAAQLAAEQPQFVGNLVLISPVIERPLSIWRRYALKAPYLGQALVWAEQAGGPVWEWRVRRAFVDAEQMPSDYFKRLRATMQISGTVTSLLVAERAPHDDDLPEALATLQAPVLILRGEFDGVVTDEDAQALAKRFRSVKVATVGAAGRYIQVEQRTKTLEALLAWLPAQARS